MIRCYVVTGAARGVGRAIADRLLRDGPVVGVDREWPASRPDGLVVVTGDAADEEVVAHAAELAGPLGGWVNNAAVFRDASLHAAPAREVLDLITLNVGLAVTGCAAAVKHFLAAPPASRPRCAASTRSAG